MMKLVTIAVQVLTMGLICGAAEALTIEVRTPEWSDRKLAMYPPRGMAKTVFAGDVVVRDAAEPVELWLVVTDEKNRERKLEQGKGLGVRRWNDGLYTLQLYGHVLKEYGTYRVSAFAKDATGTTAEASDFGTITYAEKKYEQPEDDPMRAWPMWPPYPQYNLHRQVSRNQAQPFVIAPLNLTDKITDDWSIEFDLPQGVAIMDAVGRESDFSRPTVSAPEPVDHDGVHRFRQSVRLPKVRPSGPKTREADYAQRGGMWAVCTLATDESASLGKHAAYWRETVPPATEPGPWREMTIEVLPRAVGNPDKGLEVEICSSWLHVVSPPEQEAILRTWKDIGVTVVECGPPYQRYRTRGFKTLFKIEHPLLVCWDKDPNHARINRDGKADAKWCCPSYFLTDPAREVLKTRLTELLTPPPDALHYIAENASPCYCPRCVEGFRAQHKIAPDAKLDAETLDGHYHQDWLTFNCKHLAQVAAATKTAMARIDPKMTLWAFSYPQIDYARKRGTDWRFLADPVDVAMIPWGVGEKTREIIGGRATILARVIFAPTPAEYHQYFDNTLARHECAVQELRRYVEASGGNGLRLFTWLSMEGGWYHAVATASRQGAKPAAKPAG